LGVIETPVVIAMLSIFEAIDIYEI